MAHNCRMNRQSEATPNHRHQRDRGPRAVPNECEKTRSGRGG
jgi:hypothetical protein